MIFAGGINDGASGAAVQAPALAMSQAARSLQPGAVFVVLGSWSGSGGPKSATLTVENAIAAAVTQSADASTGFVPVSTDPIEPWITAVNGPVINAPGEPGTGNPD